MYPSGLPLEATLIIDNCVLVTLHEYYCEEQRYLPPRDLVVAVSAAVGMKLDLMRACAPDGALNSTDRVVGEFRPGSGSLGKILGSNSSELKTIRSNVDQRLQVHQTDESVVRALRSLPGAPPKLGSRLDRLSDQDLSLVALALRLSSGQRTYILTNDHDLLDLVWWLRGCPQASDFGPKPKAVWGMHGLLYIEAIHRSCKIPSDEMEHLVSFCLLEELKRERLAGTSKGASIYQTMEEVWASFNKSKRAKQRQKGGM